MVLKPRLYHRCHIWGYARLSPMERDELLAAQVQAIKRKFRTNLKHKHRWGGLFVEGGVPSCDPLVQRPQGFHLNRVLEAGDIVLCASVDRVFGRIEDMLETLKLWEARGVRLWSCATGPVKVAIAEEYLKAIKQGRRESIQGKLATKHNKKGLANGDNNSYSQPTPETISHGTIDDEEKRRDAGPASREQEAHEVGVPG